MITMNDLCCWGLSHFNVTQFDLNDLNNSVCNTITEKGFGGEVDINIILSLQDEYNFSPYTHKDTPEYAAVKEQEVKNYFLVRGILNNNINEVKSAISVGADVSAVSYCSGSRITPIVTAAKNGILEIVKRLVDAGVDVNQSQMNGENALAIAVNFDNYDIAEYLLEHGANPNIIAHSGLTPLAVAENVEMVRLLLAYGADPNIPDCNGDLPIVARIENHDQKSVDLLIEAGTDLDRKDKDGKSARDIYNEVNLFYFGMEAILSGSKEEFVKNGSDLKLMDASLSFGQHDINVGDIIEFGSYWQNSSSYKEPIEWRVLDVKDGKALLISKYALDCQPYNEEYKSVTWETCMLRRWLNSSFYNDAFSINEQPKISDVVVTADVNPNFDTGPGNNTKDKIFLLSIDEVESYFSSDSDRMCAPTQYAINQGVWVSSSYKVDGKAACHWWLRSPGNDSYFAAYVYSVGVVLSDGSSVDRGNYAVRPALWINLES